MSVSKQQHTYPSPNPSLDRTCYQFTLIRLVVFPSFPALSAKGAMALSPPLLFKFYIFLPLLS